MNKITGLIAATFAAYHTDGSLNNTLIPALVEKMIDDGVAGVFICGTNGEGPNLTVAERMEVAEAYVAAAAGRILVLVHVGHSSIAESRKLAAHAERIGADAISAVSAFYFKPSDVGNMVDCMAEIASAAPNTPFYYYHIPALTGVAIDMVTFLELAGPRIPNLAGIKYTAATLHEYQACVSYQNGRFDVLFGYDELLLPALAVGARGAIGSTYNFAAPLYLQVMKLFAAGLRDEAAAMQLHAVNMVRNLVKFPPIPAQRAIMSHLGFDLGPCRLPLTPLKTSQADDLIAALGSDGFFDAVDQNYQLIHSEHEN
ncbi:N-acetylneuraminate lyase [Pedobacter yulinensis]|uniref:N-acetylneuraminate lyase n=1 Tax=Pedobacter yulinensis TaxID=2126353 RepID=A0A2T3HN47_9SPHI|nr:dihydrodipicolinate synthase family protein [Pedobacter yulinensis]PST83865.1 N-acetylneuraminate lyase [Pedobacter yulinensis]